MRIQVLLATAVIALLGLSTANAVTVQDPNWVLSDGTAVMWLEAESLLENDVTPEDTGWLIVDSANPFITTDQAVKGEQPALPADTNAFPPNAPAGILDLLGGGNHTDVATWEMQFTTPGTYYLYSHFTMYNRDNNTNYGNEDSIFLPPAFNMNSSSDWIGFEGVDELGDPKTGDSNLDG